MQGDSRQFYVEVMEDIYVEFWWRSPNFFDSNMFRAVRVAILAILNKINQANFFKSPRGKIPTSAHVKLQKLMLGAELKLHSILIVSWFHILASRAIRDKNMNKIDQAVFFIRGPSFKTSLGENIHNKIHSNQFLRFIGHVYIYIFLTP